MSLPFGLPFAPPWASLLVRLLMRLLVRPSAGLRALLPMAIGFTVTAEVIARPDLARTDARQLRADEIASCLPGEQQTWGDGRDRAALASPLRLAYRHDGAPPWFSSTLVMQSLLRAAEAWSACGVQAFVVPAVPGRPLATGAVLVFWDDPASAGTFGLAHLSQRTLALGAGAFQLLRERNPRYPADEVLQMVISHEMGHFFGLMGHSRRCVDVMSYYTDAQGQTCSTRDGGSYRRLPEYRALLPTACDIARCRAANGVPAVDPK